VISYFVIMLKKIKMIDWILGLVGKTFYNNESNPKTELTNPHI